MSNSLVSKSIASNMRIEGEDLYSTVYVENLLGVIKKIKKGFKRMEKYSGYCSNYN